MQKKLVSTIILVILASSILAFSIRPASCTIVFSQNFDGETTGSTPEGWFIEDSSVISLAVDDVVYYGSSGKSARYADISATSSECETYRTFEDQHGLLEFSFAIMPKSPEYFGVYVDDCGIRDIEVDEGALIHGANIYFLPNGAMAYYDDSGFHGLRSFSVDTWYQIKMVIDVPANTYDIYIDGSMEAEGAHFKAFGQATYLNRIEFGGNTVEMPTGYIDEILLVSQEYQAPTRTVMTLTGSLDYLLQEDVKIRLDALIKDISTMAPVSNASVDVKIYYPNGSLWISDTMTEEPTGTGIYEWESVGTIHELNLEKGVYLVQAEASIDKDLPSTEILLFHIDPPTEAQTVSTAFQLYYTMAAIALIGGTILAVFLKRHRKELKTSMVKVA